MRKVNSHSTVHSIPADQQNALATHLSTLRSNIAKFIKDQNARTEWLETLDVLEQSIELAYRLSKWHKGQAVISLELYQDLERRIQCAWTRLRTEKLENLKQLSPRGVIEYMEENIFSKDT